MLKTTIRLFAALLCLLIGANAVAETPQPANALNLFFDKIIEASSQDSCEKTEQALAKIPDAEFEHAQTLMQSLSTADLEAIHQKIDRIISKTAHCAKAQDAFASRLSRLALQSHIKDVSQTGLKANIGVLRQFVAECSKSIIPDNCTDSAKHLETSLTKDLCDKTIIAFKSTPPDSLSDTDHTFIANGLANIIKFAGECPEYNQIYRACLKTNTSASIQFITVNQIQPFMVWLSELERIITTTSCEDLSAASQTIPQDIVQNARKSVKSLSPQQLTDDTKQQLKTRMQRIYQAASRCPNGSRIVDDCIETLFGM